MRKSHRLGVWVNRVIVFTSCLFLVLALRHQWAQYQWKKQAHALAADFVYAPPADSSADMRDWGKLQPTPEEQASPTEPRTASVFTVCNQWGESLVVFAFEQSEYSRAHPQEPLQYHDILMLYVSVYNDDWTKVRERIDASAPDKTRELWLRRLFEVINNPITGCFGDLEKQPQRQAAPPIQTPRNPVRKRRLQTRPDAFVASGFFY